MIMLRQIRLSAIVEILFAIAIPGIAEQTRTQGAQTAADTSLKFVA